MRAYIATYDGENLEPGVTNEYETSFITECEKTVTLALLSATHTVYTQEQTGINFRCPCLGDNDEDVLIFLPPRSFRQIEILRRINGEEYYINDGAMTV